MDSVEREAYREYDMRGLFDDARQRALDQYAAGEITEEEVEEKLEALAENTNTAARLEKHMTEIKSQKYEDLQEQYGEDEISEEELERRMGELFESGDDFLDEEPDDGPTLGKYAFPISVALPFLFVLLMPNINAMIVVVAAPALLVIGALMFVVYYAYRNF